MRSGRRSGWPSSRATPRSPTRSRTTVDGSTLHGHVERCYFAFRRRLRDIGQASTCDCNACIRMPSLDLKVVAHHGPIVRQRIAGREELVGSPVIVVHRLLKNHVAETTGFRAYALYTEACLAAMGIDDPGRRSASSSTARTYDGVGEIDRLGRATSTRPGRPSIGADARRRRAEGGAIATVEYDAAGAAAGRLGLPHLAGSPARVAGRRRPRSSRRRPAGGAASGPSTTASTARTRSSRRSSTGGRPTTSRSAGSCRSRASPKVMMHLRARAEHDGGDRASRCGSSGRARRRTGRSLEGMLPELDADASRPGSTTCRRCSRREMAARGRATSRPSQPGAGVARCRPGRSPSSRAGVDDCRFGRVRSS